jgi:hypothetical protein
MRTLDWNTKEATAKKMSDAALDYSIKDCLEARDAAKGWNPENECYYQDEASVYSTEKRRRAARLAK